MNQLIDQNEALNVLRGFNPWWTGRPFAQPEFHRLAFEACQSFLAEPSLRRALLLSGPRRVGKTTILLQIALGLVEKGRDPRSILYVSQDHPLLRLLTLPETLRLYHEAIYPEGQPALLLLDEVQYARGWETEIKLLVDHHPEYRILATGSASVLHHDRLAESGVGRWVTVPVPTLSFYEFVHIRGGPVPEVPERLRPSALFGLPPADLPLLGARFRPLLPQFQRYLLVGGFPETASQENIALCQRLLREDVVERVLKRDMTSLFGIRNVNELEKLFIYLCLHTGSIVAHKTLAAALETSTTTVANHLHLLEQANLIYRLPPAETGGKKVLKARNKYYLVDAALRNAVLLRGEEIFMNPGDMGLIVETTVLRHLYAYYYRDTPEIVYFRDAATQKEVDIIIRSPAYVLPFEVKYQEAPSLEEDSGLLMYSRKAGVKKAYWVTKREQDFGVVSFDEGRLQVLKVPAHILCYLLGQAERLLWTGQSPG